MPAFASQTLSAAFCRSARPRIVDTPAGPKPRQVDYPDRDVRGLALRVSPGGQKTWTFRYRDRTSGMQSRFTLGLFDPTQDTEPDEQGVRALTLQGARIAARKLRAQVDSGQNPARERRRARSSVRAQTIRTLADLAEIYFSACETGTHRTGRGRKKAESTLTAERWLWRKHIQPALGSEPLDEITRSQIRTYLQQVLQTSGGQSNRARALLSQMFNFAIAEERLAANPVTHVARMTEYAARTRTLSDAELKAVWNAFQSSDHLSIVGKKAGEKVLISRPVRIALELALFTLQRRSEIAGMKLVELDLVRRTWLIPAERTKGRTEHLVPLSQHALHLIEEAIELQGSRKKGASEFLFPSPFTADAAIEPAALSHAMADVSSALNLADVRLHDLRRTGATGVAALGFPPFVVSKVLAHKDGGGGAAITARHYNLYAYAEEKRTALDAWARHLEQLFELSPTPAKRPDDRSTPTPARAPTSEPLWTELVEAQPLRSRPMAHQEPLWTDLVQE
jgi:integrase